MYSLSIFSSSHVVVVYDGNRAAMKAKRLWHSTKREAFVIALVGFQNRRISLLELRSQLKCRICISPLVGYGDTK